MEIADQLAVPDPELPEVCNDNAPSPPASLAPTYPSVWQSFGILLIFLLCTVAAVPILLVVRQIDADLAMLLFYVTGTGMALAIAHTVRNRKTGSSCYRIDIDSWKLVLPLVIASVALLFGVIGPLISLIPMPREVSESFTDAIGRPSPALFITLVVAAPVLEELLFRGIMLDGLLNRYGATKSILVSSVVFGLAHLNPWQFVTAFVMGCFAGWVYYRTRSIGPCILIHATINFCAYSIQLLVGGMETPDRSQEFQGGWGAIMIFPALCLLVLFVSFHYLRQEFDRVELAKADQSEASTT